MITSKELNEIGIALDSEIKEHKYTEDCEYCELLKIFAQSSYVLDLGSVALLTLLRDPSVVISLLAQGFMIGQRYAESQALEALLGDKHDM